MWSHPRTWGGVEEDTGIVRMVLVLGWEEMVEDRGMRDRVRITCMVMERNINDMTREHVSSTRAVARLRIRVLTVIHIRDIITDT